jgi:hypothetical protein
MPESGEKQGRIGGSGNSFTDAASLTWSKVVVGAVAEASIMAGYPDGSFGPKRPISRAESVVTLNRSLPAPISGGTTTTTTSSGGSDEEGPYGTPVQLSGLTVTGGGVLDPSFSSGHYTYTYTTSVDDIVTVLGTPRQSGYVVRYGVNGAALSTSANGVSVSVPGTVVIRVSQSSSSSSAYREYSVTVKRPDTPGEGTLWEEIERIDIVQGGVPQFGVTFSDLTIYIKEAYQGDIDTIFVKEKRAEKQAGTPETWTVSVDGHITLSDLVFTDIVVTKFASGGLPEEIEKVDITPGEVPQFGVQFSDLVIYIKTNYTNQIASIIVDGKSADKHSGVQETWTVSVNGHVTQAQLPALIRVNRTGGSREELEISPGTWPAPILRVTKQDASVPQFGIAITDVRVYVSGTVTGVKIKEKDATYTNGAWLASFNEDVSSFTLSTGQVQVSGDNGEPGPSEPASKELGIKKFTVGYDYSGGGYIGDIELELSGDLNVQSIQVKDAAGSVLAEYPGGTGGLGRLNAYQYNGLIEAVAGADKGESDANAAPLAGKVVTVTVTPVSGDPKTMTADYKYEP